LPTIRSGSKLSLATLFQNAHGASVATVFSGLEGKQVPVAETVRGFKEILEGKHDAVAEGDFYMKGGIDEVKPS
jgi:F0F1-type ATP synthase beta subunit